MEKIALREIAFRQASGESVDEAEVRLAYRVGLQARLELPGQPRTMWFRAIARVSEADLRRRTTKSSIAKPPLSFFSR